MTERDGVGRRATDGEVVAVVESSFLRKFAIWFIVAGAALFFTAGAWAKSVDKDIAALKENQFTKRDAAELIGVINVLRADLQRYERNQENRR